MKIAGVDEVGIGCLAGPLISAAVIFGKNKSEYFFKDSKKTTQKNRTVQANYIKSNFYVGIGVASPSEIDELNVLRASHLAMIRAIENLPVIPEKIIIDGIHTPKGLKNAEAMIKGDENHQEIAAASIVAKYFRDQLMLKYAKEYEVDFFKETLDPEIQVLLELTESFDVKLIDQQTLNSFKSMTEILNEALQVSKPTTLIACQTCEVALQ